MDTTITLPDGRTLSVWAGGSPEGVPVVFHHGTPSGRLQAALGADAAVRQNVRIVSFNRPGYGDSTDTPPGLASVGVDTLRVADALGIQEFAVLGASGGGPYALATGLADPGRVRAVGVVGGVGPWRLIEAPDSADPDLPILALVDAGDVPGALEGFRVQARANHEDMLALPDDAMIDAFFRDAPAEDVTWLDQEARRRWAADARDALRTYDGYARDNISWGGPWDIDPTDLQVPTWLWYGELDRMVPPSHGHWHAAQIPNSTLTIVPAIGHGRTIFARWDEMLGVLRDAVQ